MGKSFVLSVFKELGAIVLDSDDIIDLLLHNKDVILNIKKIIEDQIEKEDSTIDKGKIAKIIFNNNKLRYKLEALLHPMVFDEIETSLKKIKAERQLAIVEVPLLFECGYQNRFNKTITVFTTKKIAIDRLMNSGVTRSNALKRLKAQLPIQIKKKKSDYLIDNTDTRQKTRKQVKNIWKQLHDQMVQEI